MNDNPVSGTIPLEPPQNPQDPTPPQNPPLQTEGQAPIPVVSQPEPEKTLLSWTSPSRVFKKRNREFYTTVGALVILLSVILLFAKEFLLIGVILSFGFVSYVLATIPPHPVDHRLTNKGIRTDKKIYTWPNLGRYWWEKKWGQSQLMVENLAQFPGRLTLLRGNTPKKDIDKVMKKYLVHQKPQPTWFDNAAKWLQEKVPLESSKD